MGSIVSPRMLGKLGAFFPATCTIQEATVTQDEYGQPVEVWADKAGHTNIACRVSPSGGREVKQAAQTYAVASHTIALAGYYPTITTAMRVVSGGQTYDILAVESDGCGATTWLQCQVVT